MLGLHCNDAFFALASDGGVRDATLLDVSVARRSAAPDFGKVVAALAATGVSNDTSPAWIAVPASVPASMLGDLLRQLRSAGIDVQGFVDAAVVAAAWLAPAAQVLSLDVWQHGAAFSVVGRSGTELRLRRTAPIAAGSGDLLGGWVRHVAGLMVRQTRFDPLHDPAHEARLRAALPGLAAAVERDGVATFQLEAGSRDLAVTLSRDQFMAGATAWFAPFTETMQALCAGMGDCQLQVPATLLAWPGFRELCEVAGQRPVLSMSAGTIARAASLLPPVAGTRDAGAVQYLTQLPALPVGAPPDAAQRVASRRTDAHLAATHLVVAGRAVPIPPVGLVLGRQLPDLAHHISLPEGIAGLSRRHCTLSRSGDETVLVDHSHHGTFVDGQRVQGRALLLAGSLLRLGSPGIELPLIAVGPG